MCRRLNHVWACGDGAWEWKFCKDAQRKGILPCQTDSFIPVVPDRVDTSGKTPLNLYEHCCTTECCRSQINKLIGYIEQIEDEYDIPKHASFESRRAAPRRDDEEVSRYFESAKASVVKIVGHHFEACLSRHGYGELFTNKLKHETGNDKLVIYPVKLEVPNRKEIPADKRAAWEAKVDEWTRYRTTEAERASFRKWQLGQVRGRHRNWDLAPNLLQAIEQETAKATTSMYSPPETTTPAPLFPELEQRYIDMEIAVNESGGNPMWTTFEVPLKTALKQLRKAINRRYETAGNLKQAAMDTSANTRSSSSEEDSIIGTTQPTITTDNTGKNDKSDKGKQKMASDTKHRAGLQSQAGSKAPKHLSSKATKATPTQQVSVSSVKAVISSIKSATSDSGSLTESVGGTGGYETRQESSGRTRPPANYSKLYQYIVATSKFPLGTSWAPPDFSKAIEESEDSNKPLSRPQRADTGMSLSSQPPDRLYKTAGARSLSGSSHGSTESTRAAIVAGKAKASSRSGTDIVPGQRVRSNAPSRTSSPQPGRAPGDLPSRANTNTRTQSPTPHDELYDCTPPEEYESKNHGSSKSKGSNVSQNSRGGKKGQGRGGSGGAPRGSGVQ